MFVSSLPRPGAGFSYNRVIGENPGGLYMLRYRDAEVRNRFTLERYTHGLDFIQEQPMDLGKKGRLVKVFTRDSGMVFVLLERNRQEALLNARWLGHDLQTAMGQLRLGSIQNLESSEALAAEFSPDRNWCSIWVEEVTPDGRQRIRNIMLHTGRRSVFENTFVLQFPWKSVRIDEGSVSNSGAAACALVFEDDSRRNADPASRQVLVCHNDTTGFSEAIPINAGKFFVSGLDMVSDEFSGHFLVSGFYDYKNPGGAHGLFSLSIGPGGHTYGLRFLPFDRAFVAGLIGAREEEKGEEASEFYIRKIVPRDDGGMLVIAEHFHITQQLETFYLNGVPQTSSRNVFNYDDVMFVAMDSTGSREWTYTLRKRQSSFAAGAYFNSIGIYVCDSSVNLLYNDHASQNNRVMHVSLDRSGNLEQKVLFSSENTHTAIVPFEGKQTGYNRYVVPLVKDKQTTLVKLKMP